VWQTAEYGNQTTSSSGAEVNGAMNFKMSDIQGIASWLAVFDQYQIREIEAWITCASGTNISVDNFRWLTVVDYDDSITPTFNGLLQYSNVTDAGRQEAVYRRFRPHVALGILVNSGSLASAAKKQSMFIDSANQTALHYGLKWSLSATATTAVLAVRVRFHLQFRNNI